MDNLLVSKIYILRLNKNYTTFEQTIRGAYSILAEIIPIEPAVVIHGRDFK